MQSVSSATFLKYFLNLLCAITMFAAVCVISNGVMAFGDAGFTSGAYLTAAMVYAIIFHSIFGCCASLRGSRKLVNLFIIIAVVFIICEIIYMAIYATMKDFIAAMVDERVEHLWRNEQLSAGAMGSIQMKYKCCGKDGAQDYMGNLPRSCCQKDGCYSKGCHLQAITLFEVYSKNLFISLMGLIGIQVIDIICAYMLGRGLHVKKNKEVSG